MLKQRYPDLVTCAFPPGFKTMVFFFIYPEWAREMIMTQTWVLDCEPTREEAYKRLNRFIYHCNKLGIPNPYSSGDIYNADERWAMLHKNAVPSLVSFKNCNIYINENRKIKPPLLAENPLYREENFDF